MKSSFDSLQWNREGKCECDNHASKKLYKNLPYLDFTSRTIERRPIVGIESGAEWKKTAK